MLVFQKLEPLIYISHRDFISLMERLFRKSRLPIAYKNKNKPVMKFDIIQPLSVGVQGQHELLHFSLTESLHAKTILCLLKEHQITGFVIKKISSCKQNSKWFHHHKLSMDYKIKFTTDIDPVIFGLDKFPFILKYHTFNDTLLLTVRNTPDQQSNLKELLFSLPNNLDIMNMKRTKLTFR